MWESDADLRRDLDEMVAVGAQWVRLDFNWSAIEPAKGSFSWSNTDRVLDAVTARGLKVVAILHDGVEHVPPDASPVRPHAQER